MTSSALRWGSMVGMTSVTGAPYRRDTWTLLLCRPASALAVASSRRHSGSGGEVTVEHSHRDDHDRDAGEDVGDGVEALVVDAAAEDDGGDDRRSDRADVAERAIQARSGTDLLGSRLGVQGGLITNRGRADRDREDQSHADDRDLRAGSSEKKQTDRPHQHGHCRDD